MSNDKINAAVEAARLFIERAGEVTKDHGFYELHNGVKLPNSASPRETGALRRQSMELTRALAEMRKP